MINLYWIRPKAYNIGNQVIHLGINHFIRDAFKENFNIISIPATSRYETSKKSGLSSEVIYEINQFGDGVIVGGGNLYENGELEINATALKALSKPMMIFSVSRGRIYNQNLELIDRTDVMTDTNIQLLNKRADISLSRDKATAAYIEKVGCESIVGGCPTLFINEIPQHMVPIMNTDKTDALISLRHPSLMSIPVKHQYELRDHILKVIDILKKRGYKNIKFLCHDHRDIPFAASFSDMEYLYTEDVYTYLTFLKNTKLNITFRLHSFIPCISYAIPTINLSYDERAMSMIDTIGLGKWNIDLVKENLEEGVIQRMENLAELENSRDQLKNTIWKDLRNTLTQNTHKFASLVRDNKC